MAINLDIAADFLSLIDNPESVTVVLRPNGDRQEVEIETAHRSVDSLDRQVVDGFSFGSGSKSSWAIPDSQLNPDSEGRTITTDDLILTSETPSVTFAVLSSVLVSLGNSKSYWRCMCSEQL